MFSSSDERDRGSSPSLPELNILDLERMSDEEFWNYAHSRAHILPDTPSHAEYLECKLSGRICLIALRNLAEVLSPPHRLARLPGMPPWMVGITAWRGETIAVVNLDLYLLLTQDLNPLRAEESMLLVIHSAGQVLGLLVPAIGLTTTIEFEQISALSHAVGLVRMGNNSIVDGLYQDIPILNISALLAALVQQIGVATAHG